MLSIVRMGWDGELRYEGDLDWLVDGARPASDTPQR